MRHLMATPISKVVKIFSRSAPEVGGISQARSPGYIATKGGGDLQEISSQM